MKIAMLTYSVKPRGGVVHAVEVSEALARRGHDVELMALGRPGEDAVPRDAGAGADRPPHAGGRPVRRAASRRMIEAYSEGLRPLLGGGRFDIVHAQDCLSANAALALRDEGAIEHVIRTVHHVDDFTSPSLVECQDRSIVSPDHVLCVSPPWVERLRDGVRRQRRRSCPTGWTRTASGRRATPPSARRAPARRRRRRPPGRPDRRRRRAAQGLADAARGLRAPARDARLPRPAAADRRRRDPVRLPPRARPLRGARAASSA